MYQLRNMLVLYFGGILFLLAVISITHDYHYFTHKKGKKPSNNDLIRRLPGQPFEVSFKQFAGYINVNETKGRSLFYYFVEAAVDVPTSKPVLLWLNGGPGCSSLGDGAFIENGPFGVRRDGRTLYLRKYSWNRVANIIYLESPAGVGFSYSNTSTDYSTTGNSRTAQDLYVFMTKWFNRFSRYRYNDFYIAGEDYAGVYIPDLTDLILRKNGRSPSRSSSVQIISSSGIRLKGIMIGNPFLDTMTDLKGRFDYLRNHALISRRTYDGLMKNCIGLFWQDCISFQQRAAKEMGRTNVYNIHSPNCRPNSNDTPKVRDGFDICKKNYVQSYLNRPMVQRALHANITGLDHPWSLYSVVINTWGDWSSTKLPILKRLMEENIRIFLYSGDDDAVIPVTSTEYAIDALNLTIKDDWRPWLDDSQEVAGSRVDYDGLTFMTVLGAGHEVPMFQPRKAFKLLQIFLEGA